MEDKDFIGMYCCPVCKEPMGVLMNTELKKTLQKHQTIGPELCNKCKQKFTEENKVIIYEADEKGNILGNYVIISRDAFCNLDEKTEEFIDKNRFIFMTSEDFSHLLENYNENQN